MYNDYIHRLCHMVSCLFTLSVCYSKENLVVFGFAGKSQLISQFLDTNPEY